MILDADGNPIEKPKTLFERISPFGKQLKKFWIVLAAILGALALALTNLQTITDFFSVPKPSIEFVKVSTKRNQVEVVLKNRGEATGLVTACDLVVDSTYSSEFSLVEQSVQFLPVEKEFDLKFEANEKRYDLDEFRLELKPDATVVFVVNFDNHDVDWTCIKGVFELELEGGESVVSKGFESTTGGFFALGQMVENDKEGFEKLLGDLREFSTDPESSIAKLIERIEPN